MRIIAFIVATLLSYPVLGQDTTGIIQVPSRTVLKFSPLALIEFDPMLQAGIEYRISNRKSLQAEVGYGWAGLGTSVWSSSYQHGDSWRARTELRKYSGRFQTNKRKNIQVKTSYPLGNYWALELFWKEIQVIKNWKEVMIDEKGNAIGEGPDRQSPIRKTIYGVNLKLGRQFPLSRRNDKAASRVLMDVYVGTGVRASQVVHSADQAMPGYAYRPSWFDRFIAHDWRGLPGFTAGIKIGYASRY